MEEHDHDTYTVFMVTDTLMRGGHWEAIDALYKTVLMHSDKGIQFYMDWLVPLHWVRSNADEENLSKIKQYAGELCAHVERLMKKEGREAEIERMLGGLRHN
jgi:hypothetical protein